jgi:hypothetical protein
MAGKGQDRIGLTRGNHPRHPINSFEPGCGAENESVIDRADNKWLVRQEKSRPAQQGARLASPDAISHFVSLPFRSMGSKK